MSGGITSAAGAALLGTRCGGIESVSTGMGSKDSFVVPLAWNYGLGGHASIRWLPWELEGSYVHLWRTENAPDYEVPDILEEDRVEVRLMRYVSSPAWFAFGARYSDYGGVGRAIGATFSFSPN